MTTKIDNVETTEASTDLPRDRKALINAYTQACDTLGLDVVEANCILYSEEPDGDPVLYVHGRIYEHFGVSNGYCIPKGEGTVGYPPKVRYLVKGQPTLAMHWKKP